MVEAIAGAFCVAFFWLLAVAIKSARAEQRNRSRGGCGRGRAGCDPSTEQCVKGYGRSPARAFSASPRRPTIPNRRHRWRS